MDYSLVRSTRNNYKSEQLVYDNQSYDLAFARNACTSHKLVYSIDNRDTFYLINFNPNTFGTMNKLVWMYCDDCLNHPTTKVMGFFRL